MLAAKFSVHFPRAPRRFLWGRLSTCGGLLIRPASQARPVARETPLNAVAVRRSMGQIFNPPVAVAVVESARIPQTLPARLPGRGENLGDRRLRPRGAGISSARPEHHARLGTESSVPAFSQGTGENSGRSGPQGGTPLAVPGRAFRKFCGPQDRGDILAGCPAARPNRESGCRVLRNLRKNRPLSPLDFQKFAQIAQNRRVAPPARRRTAGIP